ncbi:branched-chain amino acid ABC transporter permease [Pseudolabrys sp.]|uniref:branched-chain amino acid ABC transporter permease n=1 Tax=Pseudolabrys sp. TaxID=1960880 RepID=UPI003D134539
MNATVFAILVQDGVISGAIYALVALSLVLVFTITRIIFIPQGEIIAYGALTFVAIQSSSIPTTAWLSAGLGAVAATVGLWMDRRGLTPRGVSLLLAETIALPVGVLLLVHWLVPLKLGALADIALTLLVVTPIGSYIYSAAFRPLSEASILVLLIAAVGVHLSMTGIGLIFFGPEGWRASALFETNVTFGGLMLGGQSLWILAVTAMLITMLYVAFEFTVIGKALRATAVNRIGARLVGISPHLSGRLAVTLATFIGALSGVLIVPIVTIYYDTGFLIGLKGFVAAMIGALISYPIAAAGAILVGILESFSSYWASSLKEVIVFTSIIPVLLWRSLRSEVVEEDE